jgi:hypothetical protein
LSRSLVAMRTGIESSPIAGDGSPVTAAPVPRRYA